MQPQPQRSAMPPLTNYIAAHLIRANALRKDHKHDAHITATYADKLKISICWAGSNGYVVNYARSVGYERFLPLTRHPYAQLF